ncbi:hypothetical protein GCM10017771_49780 [Streptomyces capitiformicae]|uniref:Fibrillarin n=1 Tax=Streptomyces capitiformicae TaxID=2014920 RepID=A0A918Z0W2_9ACTN|nr:hypothetical protein GCM10017771_49780 [Streptomyces capitiformicae]
MAHAALGGLAAVGWLLLPSATDTTDTTDTTVVDRPAAPAVVAQTEDGESSATDLILPVAAAGAAAAVATYSLVRRRRRTALRTTPTATFEEHLAPLSDLHRRGQRLLVETDDSVRTSAEELRFAAARSGDEAAKPYVEVLTEAQGELAIAFRLRQRLDEPGEGADTLSPDDERALLEEILARCTTAQRRLDAAAPGFDQLRALERETTPALECAEARFRELTGRTATAATTLAGLRERYAPTACLPVVGHVEQAKDRLVFATVELNRARQAADTGNRERAAMHLRAAEGAVDQADVFVTGVERLAVELARAAETAKRGAPFTGPYDDPLGVLRRQGRWPLPAHSAVTATADFVTTHRGAVGVRARTRLAEAERHLVRAEDEGAQRSHTLAQEARHLAEQDVRAYGNPYGGPVGDGIAGALLGGILLSEAHGGERGDLKGPACYGGTATRGRRAVGGQF